MPTNSQARLPADGAFFCTTFHMLCALPYFVFLLYSKNDL